MGSFISITGNVPDKIKMDLSNLYVKTDNNLLLSSAHIKWVKQMDECMEICADMHYCTAKGPFKNTYSVCKVLNPKSYKNLKDLYDCLESDSVDIQ